MAENLGVIDIGGTTIKFGVWNGHELIKRPAIKTPTLLDDFYQLLNSEVSQMKADYQIIGVGISSPGAVNKKTGVVEGASAIPYLHNFPIQQRLSHDFGLPVSMENDANCAALAELADGAGKDVSSLCFLIIGTGVGGSVIFNHHIWHGAHLFGGEFGFTMVDDQHTLSELGTAGAAATRYQERVPNRSDVTGKELFDLAVAGDSVAQEEVSRMYQVLAKAIYNLQYSFDPERIIIGGAVSNNTHLISGITREIEKIRQQVEIASIKPEVVTCYYHDQANLRGAVVDFEQTYPKLY